MVEWSQTAIADAAGHAAYIAEFNPHAAARILRALYAAGNSLATFPRRDRMRSEGLRELAIVHPYLLVYELTGEQVRILRVWHGAQSRE